MQEREFVRLVLEEGLGFTEASARAGWDRTNYKRLLARPRVAAYYEELRQEIEARAKKKLLARVELNLDKADDRLGTMLSRPSMDEEKMLLLGAVGRTKAGVELIEKKGLLDPKPDAGEGPAIADMALLKAIDLAYKRKNGYSGQAKALSATAQAIVAVLGQPTAPGGEGVYESRWIREQYGIDDPVSEAIDRKFDAIASGTEAPGKTLGTGDAAAKGSSR